MPRLDEFMAAANAAFYARPDPLAAFVTAPELTQVFGELLGLWAAVTWEEMGQPEGALLCEAGPGRGTLMRDAHRALARLRPVFLEKTRLHFIETSPSLTARLHSLFPEAAYHASLDTLPPGPLIFIANEFLDALPVRQFVFHAGVWQERYVEGGNLVLCPLPSPPPHPALAVPGEEGDVFEWGEAREAFIAGLARRLKEEGGTALLIDYGPYRSGFGETLQAIAGGRPVPPLSLPPGEADLTAHVDFAALARTARRYGVAVWGPLPQGVFLERLGLSVRTARLAAAASPATALSLRDAAERLARPERMGALFKAMALSTGPLPPPGFLPTETWSEGSVEGDVARLGGRRNEAGPAHDEQQDESG
jgi:NADH dehydrogenase [ubiquinone] 1 alpha subcomplex assembly factor 7